MSDSCPHMVRGCGTMRGPKHSPLYSRFGAFIPRLSPCKFPVYSATGIRWQDPDLAHLFCGQNGGRAGKTKKFPVLSGKTGNLRAPAKQADGVALARISGWARLSSRTASRSAVEHWKLLQPELHVIIQSVAERRSSASGYAAAAGRRELARLLTTFPLLFAEIEDRRGRDRAARSGAAVERASCSGVAAICVSSA